MAEIHIRVSFDKQLETEHLDALAEKLIVVTADLFHFENGKKDVGVILSKFQGLRNVSEVSILGICSYTKERLRLQQKWAESLKKTLDEFKIKGEVFVNLGTWGLYF